MGFDVSICPQCELGTIHLSGDVDGTTLLDALDQLVEDDTWKAHFDELWDFRSVAEILITAQQVDRIVMQEKTLAAMLGAGRVAMLVESITQESYANLLIRKSEYPDRTMRTFRIRSQATKWL